MRNLWIVYRKKQFMLIKTNFFNENNFEITIAVKILEEFSFSDVVMENFGIHLMVLLRALSETYICLLKYVFS